MRGLNIGVAMPKMPRWIYPGPGISLTEVSGTCRRLFHKIWWQQSGGIHRWRSFELGLCRVDPYHSNYNVSVGDENESQRQGKCEDANDQIQNKSDWAVCAVEFQQGLDLTGKMTDDTVSTKTGRNCNDRYYGWKEDTGPDHHSQLYADLVVHNDGEIQGFTDCNKDLISHDRKEQTLCHPQK